MVPLRWRHNERDGVSNDRRLDGLLNRLFGHRSKKTPKLRVIGLCEGNSPVTGELTSQKASKADFSDRLYSFQVYHDISSHHGAKCWKCFIQGHPKYLLHKNGYVSWWRHQMETFSALLVLCAGNSPVTSPHKGQWRGALMFSLTCAWINDWVNNREAGDWRRHSAHYDVTAMLSFYTIWHIHRVGDSVTVAVY